MSKIQLKDKEYSIEITNGVLTRFADETGLNPFSDLEFHSPEIASTILRIALEKAGHKFSREELIDLMGIETNFEVSVIVQKEIMKGMEYLKEKVGKLTEAEEKR